jgi:hypothetical protein
MKKFRLLIIPAIALAAWYFWPSPKHHTNRVVTKTHATWFVNPVSGKDTSSIVFRVEHDTLVRTITKIDVETGDTTWKKKWMRDTSYYLPIHDSIRDAKGHAVYDSIAKKWRDTTIFRLTPFVFIIHDDDKHY